MKQSKLKVEKLRDEHNYESKEVPHSYSATNLIAAIGVAELPTAKLQQNLGGSENVVSLFPQSTNYPKHIRDVETLSEAKLKKAYPREYCSWRNRRDYAKKSELPFHDPWKKSFGFFLRDLGPIPADGHTLDKIKAELGYLPNNVRWASKTEQTHNRSVTVWLTSEGETLPLAVWAKRTNQPESTLRWRKKQGWSDAEVISGKRLHSPPSAPASGPLNIWPPEYAERFEPAYQAFQKNHYSTNPVRDRIWFMLRISLKRMHEFDQQGFEATDGYGEFASMMPNADCPMPSELKEELEQINLQYQKFSKVWKFAVQKFYDHTGEWIGANDQRLREV